MSDLKETVMITDANRAFRTWLSSEIYTGPNGDGRYVPNVDDAVWDWDNGLSRVIDVDYTTGLSIVEKYIPPKDGNELDSDEMLLGAHPGHISESFRAYIDTSVLPHTLALDARLHVYGSTTSYVKLFKGTDISETGTVISAQYDQSGNMLGENIPLEVVAMDDMNNRSVKTPMVAYTSYKLNDGEIVTAVVYDDVGAAVSIQHLLVMNTSFVRAADASKKYVTGITIESPFISPYDEKLMEYPANVNVSGVTIMGVVNYSDGSVRKYPIDGTKFSVHGMDNYIATIVGQRIPIVLAYTLGDEEVSYGLTVNADRPIITEPYHIKTIEADGAYSVKLFTYPVWVDEVVGYRLEHYLYNLERREMHYVTPYVELGVNSPAFHGRDIGTVQQLTYALDLNKVDGKFAHYRHVQTMEISLLALGPDHRTNWTVRFTPGTDVHYGDGLTAWADFTNVNNWKLHLGNDFHSVEEWLREIFYKAEPLFDADREVEAPKPTHFIICMNDAEWEVPISEWNNTFTVHNQLEEGENVYLKFIRRMPDGDLQLSVSALPLHYAYHDLGNGGWSPEAPEEPVEPETPVVCINPESLIGSNVSGLLRSDNVTVLDKMLKSIEVADDDFDPTSSTYDVQATFPEYGTVTYDIYEFGEGCQIGYLDTSDDTFVILKAPGHLNSVASWWANMGAFADGASLTGTPRYVNTEMSKGSNIFLTVSNDPVDNLDESYVPNTGWSTPDFGSYQNMHTTVSPDGDLVAVLGGQNGDDGTVGVFMFDRGPTEFGKFDLVGYDPLYATWNGRILNVVAKATDGSFNYRVTRFDTTDFDNIVELGEMDVANPESISGDLTVTDKLPGAAKWDGEDCTVFFVSGNADRAGIFINFNTSSATMVNVPWNGTLVTEDESNWRMLGYVSGSFLLYHNQGETPIIAVDATSGAMSISPLTDKLPPIARGKVIGDNNYIWVTSNGSTDNAYYGTWDSSNYIYDVREDKIFDCPESPDINEGALAVSTTGDGVADLFFWVRRNVAFKIVLPTWK